MWDKDVKAKTHRDKCSWQEEQRHRRDDAHGGAVALGRARNLDAEVVGGTRRLGNLEVEAVIALPGQRVELRHN